MAGNGKVWSAGYKPFRQRRVAQNGLVVIHGKRQRLPCSHKNAKLPRPGKGGIEKVALQQDEMLGHQRDHHCLELGSLALVDAHAVGGDQFVEFPQAIVNDVAVKVDRYARAFRALFGDTGVDMHPNGCLL